MPSSKPQFNPVSAKRSSETTAYVRITRHSWEEGVMEGELTANDLIWEFKWCFRQDKLIIMPSLGRSLVKEPLARFLEQRDYELEAGGDYSFLIRGQV
jgi:hypothetical protein